MGCPYEGEIQHSQVIDVTKRLIDMGCYEVSLGDTIGVGTADNVKALIRLLSREIDQSQLAVHFHDTYGQALTNIYTALQAGVMVVDSAIAGLGGCPYAKGASGNVATEDVLYLLNGLGIETGIDFDKLLAAGWFISDKLGKAPISKVSTAYRAK